jgi:hypothetical protein
VSDRRSALEALVALSQPLSRVLEDLRSQRGSLGDPEVRLRPVHLKGVLDRYLRGELTAPQVHAWAEAVEVRDGVEIASDVVKEVVFDLATPELQGELSPEVARQMLERIAGEP